MEKLEHRWRELRHLDELAAQDSMIHKLHPAIKLLTTLAFIATVASFAKYEITGIIPLAFYPILLIALSNIPAGLLIRRVLIAMPFVIFIGLFNPFFDQTTLINLGPLPVSGGMVSFASIIIRLVLSILAALILIATTGIDAICGTLSAIGVPRIMATQILFVYRYLHVLAEEVIKTIRAYSLRAPFSTGVSCRAWGSLTGLLLFRAVDRAQRIYRAMLCRGFDGEVRIVRVWRLRKNDIAFFLAWLLFFAAVRSINVPQWLGSVFLRGCR